MGIMDFPQAEAFKILREGLLSLNLKPSDEQMRCFSVYLWELKKWSKAFNLTGIRNDNEIVVQHFLDSMLYLVPAAEHFLSVADIGSGAGFPGIPMKIMRPELAMYLIEPSGKKGVFLRRIVHMLQISGVTVIEKRIEEVSVPSDISAPVDIAVTRALFDIREFVRKTAHIVKPGGFFILNKGPRVTEELREAGELQYELMKIPLPQSDIVRTIVVIKGETAASS